MQLRWQQMRLELHIQKISPNLMLPIQYSHRLALVKNTVNVKLFDLTEHSSESEGMIIKNFDDKQRSINTNLELSVSNVTTSIELGTGIDTERHKPNVTIQTT